MAWIRENTLQPRKECQIGIGEKATKIVHFSTDAMIFLCDKHLKELKDACLR